MSDITTFFRPQTYVVDDFLFMEQDRAECFYFIVEGKVAMIHKASHTFLKDLKKDNFMGEIGMFKSEPRTLSAKCRDFSQIYILNGQDLFKMADQYMKVFKAIKRIQDDLSRDSYESVCTQCYICGKGSHLALKCPKFKSKEKGNLMKIYINNKIQRGEIDQHMIAGKQQGAMDEREREELQADLMQRMERYLATAEEATDNKHYQSSETEETAELKVELI